MENKEYPDLKTSLNYDENIMKSKVDTRTRLEIKYKADQISVDKAKELFPDIIEWLEEVFHGMLLDNFVKFLIKKNNDGQISMITLFWTEDHIYKIVCYHRIDRPNGYMGCYLDNRMARPGEAHIRGNDLPDGEYNKDTFKRIMNACIACEVKKIFN